MKKIRKDTNGDPNCPINERLRGLHFSCNVDYKTGEPVPFSVYGRTRLLVDVDYLFSLCPHLYFADFFCLNRPHHIVLVMTRPGSSERKSATDT